MSFRSLLKYGPLALVLAGSAVPSQAGSSPARVNRSFFEQPLEVTWTSGGRTPARSIAAWAVSAPEREGSVDPELGAPLTDFSDRMGCLEVRKGSEVRLCFQLMGDVSSVGVNDREMSFSGRSVDSIATGSLSDCAASFGSLPRSIYHLQGLSWAEGALTLRFVSHCAPPIEVSVQPVGT